VPVPIEVAVQNGTRTSDTFVVPARRPGRWQRVARLWGWDPPVDLRL